MSVKTLRKQLFAAIAMVLVAAIALGSSTYAWFVNNAQVTATNVNVTATTAYSLQIKKGTDGNYGTTTNLNGAVTFKPVSTIGAFATAKTLSPGTGIGDSTSVSATDIAFFTSDAWNSKAEVEGFKEVSKTSEHSYNATGGGAENSKYFYSDTIYLKAGQASKIYLDNTSTGVYDGSTTKKFSSYNKIDTTSLNGGELAAAKSNNEALALLQTMRVAFVVTPSDKEVGSTNSKVFIYQLNESTSGTGFAYNTTMQHTTSGDVDGLKYATSGEATVGELSSVNNYNNGIVALTDAVMATGAPTSMATAPETDADKNTLATVAANEEVQVDIYMWMEGCDYDTTAANSAQFQTTIQGIQFGFCIGANA